MSTYTDATKTSVEHCEAMAVQFPDLAATYYEPFAKHCQQKLWHQFTLLALQFLDDQSNTLRPLKSSENDESNTHLALYKHVVLVLGKKLNTLSLARMAVLVADHSHATQAAASKTLLEDLLKNQQGLSETAAAASNDEEGDAPVAAVTSATLFLQSKLALLELQELQAGTKDDKETLLPRIYTDIKTNAPLLKDIVIPDSPEAIHVNASHYELSMTYYKLVGPPEAFFEEAMHYLNYAPQGSEATESRALATDVCLAALTGEGVYNLGQVLQTPIVQALKETPDHAWLYHIVEACAAGSVTEFAKLTQQHAKEWAAQPALVHRATQVQEKMTLLALVQMVFERPAHERTLTFVEISERLGANLPLEQVEWVIMRALSVKLLEGTMDQVAGTVDITWVLPRSLTPDQMSALASRFGDWSTKVGTTKDYMVEQTPTLTA